MPMTGWVDSDWLGLVRCWLAGWLPIGCPARALGRSGAAEGQKRQVRTEVTPTHQDGDHKLRDHLHQFNLSIRHPNRYRTVPITVVSALNSQISGVRTTGQEWASSIPCGGVRPAHLEEVKKKKKEASSTPPAISPKFVLVAAYTSYVACRRGGVGTCVRGCKWTREPHCGSAPAPRFRDMRCAPRGQRTVYVHSRS